MREVTKVVIAGVLVLALALIGAPVAFADGGEMILHTEELPADVHLEESEQNAIVAWNKDTKEEIIILSKNLSSSVPVKVLEVVPLPDNPLDVDEADFEAFTTLERLAEEKLPKVTVTSQRMSDGGPESTKSGEVPVAEVTFHEEIGPHDITVAKVNTPEEFKEWVEEFCEEKGLGEMKLSQGFSDAVLSYTDKDIKHFVLDIVSTGEEHGSVFPILYRFKSDSLFYPMRITAGSDVGESTAELNLFLVARGVADAADLYAAGFTSTPFGFTQSREVKLSNGELKEVDGRLADLFGSGDVYVMNASYRGRLYDMQKDLSLTYFLESPPESSQPDYRIKTVYVEIEPGEDGYTAFEEAEEDALTIILAIICTMLIFAVAVLVFALFHNRRKGDAEELSE